jgi:hypothetical protein
LSSAGSFAYILGFAAFVLPAGAGARDWVLKEVLQNMITGSAAPLLAASVHLVRLAWTAGEVGGRGRWPSWFRAGRSIKTK